MGAGDRVWGGGAILILSLGSRVYFGFRAFGLVWQDESMYTSGATGFSPKPQTPKV